MTITIDGSHGEGGGQIIRSSLALSIITGRAVRIINVRAKRKNPGLQKQHLVALRAAGAISGAEIAGAELGSRQITFEPGKLAPGDHEFRIGTAGSTSLVLQTILPALIIAGGPSKILLEGGTHNPMAPPFDFLNRTFLPLINRMGPQVHCTLERYGFYPKGGGSVVVSINPVPRLERLDIGERSYKLSCGADILLVNLPRHVGDREEQVLRKGVPELENIEVVESDRSPGIGNVVAVHITSSEVTETITALGEKGVRAETVAEAAAAAVRQYLDSGACVGEYLADQLLLPMAIGAGGSFITGDLSEHTRTNIYTIQRFLDIDINAKPLGNGLNVVRVG